MKFNVADLPAVQEQLKRSTLMLSQGTPVASAEEQPETTPDVKNTRYPAKALVFENGRYQVVDHEK